MEKHKGQVRGQGEQRKSQARAFTEVSRDRMVRQVSRPGIG
jgi:hypothetical protein